MDNRILVVAAHPDDEVLGCGATVAKCVKHGDRVTVAILGEGATSRFHTHPGQGHPDTVTLADMARSACAELGVSDVRLFDLPDNRFDTLPLLDVIKIVEQLVSDVRPTTILTHHPSDLNIDHRVTFQAIMTATRPDPDGSVRSVITFETPSSTEWSFHGITPLFLPNLFVSVDDHMAQKLAAMAAYESESRDFPHPRSAEALSAIATRWGTVSGLRSAEAFQIMRSTVEHLGQACL